MTHFYHVNNVDITEQDKIFLLSLFEKYRNNFSVSSGSSFYKRYRISESSDDYSDHPIFKKIANLFRNTNKHHDYKHVYDNSQIAELSGAIIPHKDYRSCVLSIPLLNVNDPCHFYDENDNKIASYNYSSVCIINGWIKHGVPENKDRRCFFHVGGFGEDEQIDTLIEKIHGVP